MCPGIGKYQKCSEKEEAAILAKNEQLRANLLRAISHDLRTPLTSISGNADNLLANYQKMDDNTRKRTFTDIYDDSMWLINLVENLLAITRIEGGQVNLIQSVELMDEVIAEALRHINRKSKEHTIHITSSEELLLASIDAKLIVQVIINLVDNAIKYTSVGSVIEVHTEKNTEKRQVVVSISDNGPGILMIKSYIFLRCFTVEPIKLLTAAEALVWAFHFVNPLSQPMEEQSGWQIIIRKAQFYIYITCWGG